MQLTNGFFHIDVSVKIISMRHKEIFTKKKYLAKDTITIESGCKCIQMSCNVNIFVRHYQCDSIVNYMNSSVKPVSVIQMRK